jgi:hypothetical protein
MKYLFALLLTLSSLGAAMADSRDTTIATVPFDFVIGNKTFTAGTYRISRISDDPRAGFIIQSTDGKTNMLFWPTSSDSIPNDQTKLQFLHEGNLHFLTGIVTATDTYTLAPKHHRQEPAKADETVAVGAP